MLQPFQQGNHAIFQHLRMRGILARGDELRDEPSGKMSFS